MGTMWLALALFLSMYGLLLYVHASKRWIVAFVFAVLFVACGFLSAHAAFGAISWNVIFMLLGTMAMVQLFLKLQKCSHHRLEAGAQSAYFQ